MSTQTPDWSYQRHADVESTVSEPSVIANPESIDAWRHARMYETLRPFVQTFPQAKWMTIGDGRYGSDAFYLQKMGCDVLATSLTDASLKTAHERGYIAQYQAENAERISLEDDSIDFVLCKESYHHFPRPPIAFYEMLRVARHAVILIEPIDGSPRLLSWLKNVVKKQLRGDANLHFEVSGNFIYRASVREVEKMMTSINGSCVAFKTFNDFSLGKRTQKKYDPKTLDTVLTRVGIAVQNALCAVGLMTPGLGTVVAFKGKVDPKLESAMRAAGYKIRKLPKNPYV